MWSYDIAKHITLPKFMCSGPLTCFRISSKYLTLVEEPKASVTLIPTPSFNTVLRQFSLPFIIAALKFCIHVSFPFLFFQLAVFKQISHQNFVCSSCASNFSYIYRGAGKSLARSTSRRILFDGENISFDAGHVIYINSTNIPPIMIVNMTYETQNHLSL